MPSDFPNTDDAEQDTRFSAALALLREALQAKVFPACSLAVTHRGQPLLLRSLGQFAFDPGSQKVTDDNLFDIASITKVVATTAMAIILYELGLLDLDTPIVAIVPEFSSSWDARLK